MHDRPAGGPVLLQQRLDGCAGGGGVGDLEQAGGVFLLGVDDDERGVRGRRGGVGHAEEFAEGLDAGHGGLLGRGAWSCASRRMCGGCGSGFMIENSGG